VRTGAPGVSGFLPPLPLGEGIGGEGRNFCNLSCFSSLESVEIFRYFSVLLRVNFINKSPLMRTPKGINLGINPQRANRSSCEKNVSAKQYKKEKQARFQGKNGYQERKSCFSQPQSQGQKKAHSQR